VEKNQHKVGKKTK